MRGIVTIDKKIVYKFEKGIQRKQDYAEKGR